MTEDDDRAREFDAAPTVLEIGPLSPIPEAFVEETTAPSGIGQAIAEAREGGCSACYEEGQEDALSALRSFLLWRGADNAGAEAWVEAVRSRLTRL